MDLRNNQITVNELLKHPGAKQVLSRRFPTLAAGPVLAIAGSWTVAQVLQFARGKVPDSEVRAALEELKRL